jgi:hypothetical protein
MRTLAAMRSRALLLALTLPLAGCFLSRDMVNEPVRAKRISQLVAGTTTAAQALEILGAPTEVIQLGRRSAWRYDRTVTKRSGLTLIVFTALNEDTQSDRAWLFFDENEVLTHFGSTLTAADSEWAMPWVDSHE